MNRILFALGKADRAALLSELEPCELAARQELETPNKQIRHVYFIETGIAAVLSKSNGNSIAVGLIGCEGVSAISALLGDDRSPHATVMLCRGTALRITVRALLAQMDARPQVRRRLLCYALAFYNQAAHTALSNALSTTGQRVARWLLMTHDRVSFDTTPLTHERIAEMIGIRRAGVTDAFEQLSRRGLINVQRGSVRVLDRKGIEKVAGEFYGLPEREYARVIGVHPHAKGLSPHSN
jgi:CRP-like cAMP-binding protein